jgi:hypothetical protein
MENQFKNNQEPTIKGQFTPTDKKVMQKMLGRDVSEKLNRNPPTFEDATISMYRPGIKWLGVFCKTA